MKIWKSWGGKLSGFERSLPKVVGGLVPFSENLQNEGALKSFLFVLLA